MTIKFSTNLFRIINMKEKLIIYGNGQMALMLYHFAKVDYEVVGFTVDKDLIDKTLIEDKPVIDFNSIQEKFSAENHKMIIAVGYVEMNDIRQQRYLTAKNIGYEFINYIHPTTSINECIIGENNIILDYVSIHPGTNIGNSNFISSNTNIGHGCFIGDACWINAGVGIGGETKLGNNCFLGINATASQGITISPKTFIGANALVNKDTENNSVYLTQNAEKFRLNSEQFLNFSNAL